MPSSKISSRSKSSSKVVVVTALSIVALVALTGAVFAFNNFSILQPKASSLVLTLTQRYTDNFNNGAQVDAKNWALLKVPASEAGITISQSATDNLSIVLPSGKKVTSFGAITKKETVSALSDFSNFVVLYHPAVKGEGSARVGIRFNSVDTNDNEAAGIYWLATENGKGEKIVFYVNDGTGKRKVTKSVDIDPTKTKVAVIRLDRINNSYMGYLKKNADLTGDTVWTSVGKCIDDAATHCNKGLGKSGKADIYAYNGMTKDKFPQVVARFDTAVIRWEDATVKPPTVTSFTDAFANGVLAKSWKSTSSTGVIVSENKSNNLGIILPDTNATKKVSYSHIVRTEPVIGTEKSFAVVAITYKPTVLSIGSGSVGLSFVSATAANKEDASIRWVASTTSKLASGKNTSVIVFSVSDRTGKSVERANVTIPATVNKVSLRLIRNVTEARVEYRAWYRQGENTDANWIPVGDKAVESTLGEAGNLLLSVSNLGAKVDGKVMFPSVRTQIDQIYGTVDK